MDEPHRSPGLREAGVDGLIKDVVRIGPAPSPSREAFVTVVNLAFVGVAIAVLQPEAAVSAALVALIVAFTAIRWIVGASRWTGR